LEIYAGLAALFYMTPAAHPDVRPASDRAFGFVMGGFLALVGGWPLIYGQPVRTGAAIAAAAFLLVALGRASLLRPLNRVWTWLAIALHRVMTPAMLGVLFFAVITPVALVMRACGRDVLRLRWDRSAESYWQARGPASPAGMKEQY
jgi:hypothetical protein